MGRTLDRGFHLRERMAVLPDKERPLPGTEERLPRMRAGMAQKVAVKVVDIFGNDTMTIVEVTV